MQGVSVFWHDQFPDSYSHDGTGGLLVCPLVFVTERCWERSIADGGLRGHRRARVGTGRARASPGKKDHPGSLGDLATRESQNWRCPWCAARNEQDLSEAKRNRRAD